MKITLVYLGKNLKIFGWVLILVKNKLQKRKTNWFDNCKRQQVLKEAPPE